MNQFKINHFKIYQGLEKHPFPMEHDSFQKLLAYRHLNGAGFFDSIKSKIGDFFAVRKSLSPADQALFDSNKDRPIAKLVVVRTPLNSTVQKVLDYATDGNLLQQAKEMGYDKVYHLYLLIYLMNEEQPLLYEKNETVQLTDGAPATDKFTQAKQVDTYHPGSLTLGAFMTTAQSKMTPEEYWHYTFDDQNCQKFILQNLKSNGLLTSQLQTFILQDAAKLASSAGWFSRKIAQGTTDIAAFGRKIIGKGLAGGDLADDFGSNNRKPRFPSSFYNAILGK